MATIERETEATPAGLFAVLFEPLALKLGEIVGDALLRGRNLLSLDRLKEIVEACG